jgi:MoaA/NifB/PqqE/SkfB family radical SAM enzyme
MLNFLHAPAQVLLELTHKCNLKCRHCYLPRRLAEELTLEELLELAHQLVEAGVLQVSIGGGEPLLRFAELVELVKVLVSNGVDVVLATNGTLFGEEEARELRRAGLRTVQFSLDGVGATHDAIRGVAGCFERVVEAVKLAKSMGFKVLVKTVAQRGNVGQLPELFKLLNKRARLISLSKNSSVDWISSSTLRIIAPYFSRPVYLSGSPVTRTIFLCRAMTTLATSSKVAGIE